MLSLGSNAKRPAVDSKGIDKMIHSLESVNFLKQDRDNFVLFACTDPDCKVISIQQEFQGYDEDLQTRNKREGKIVDKHLE